MSKSLDELGSHIARGLGDVEAGRVSDGSRQLVRGMDDACYIARKLNAKSYAGTIYVTEDLVRDVDQVTFDTLQDSIEFVDLVVSELSVTFEKILVNPQIGCAAEKYRTGLRVFFVRNDPNSRAAVFFIASGADVTLISYVDEHYTGHLLHLLNVE